ncbi:hypothetical protein PAXRUDRAFT_827691 [Paxillus rubicundulus Ve08.2h10]|uniref:Unplaced genomic scaffold scaffold_265, whole genome shotgun sequence n=1 Tax=Paxillus rubicundulus Ve08.2h10 TaxID=930991 RepID=A0A0D0DC11_9AGAM|nr:hypothetical protein PAXRUDRAFT_827691 [Paxillus rubicundulus Ve08.2h10]
MPYSCSDEIGSCTSVLERRPKYVNPSTLEARVATVRCQVPACSSPKKSWRYEVMHCQTYDTGVCFWEAPIPPPQALKGPPSLFLLSTRTP